MLTRRSLLVGVAANLAASRAIPARAKGSPRVAHLVTGLDNSGSMDTQNRRKPGYTACAEVLDSDELARIFSQAPYDEFHFEAFLWNTAIKPLVPLTVVPRTNPRPALAHIATIIRAAADQRVDSIAYTDTPLALQAGLVAVAAPSDLDVINIVTDDSQNRVDSQHAIDTLRQEAIRRKVIINGLILGDPQLMNSFVTGFALNAANFPNAQQAWREKFTADIA